MRVRANAVLLLAEHRRIRDAWTTESAGGMSTGRLPEFLTREEWETANQPTVMGVL